MNLEEKSPVSKKPKLKPSLKLQQESLERIERMEAMLAKLIEDKSHALKTDQLQATPSTSSQQPTNGLTVLNGRGKPDVKNLSTESPIPIPPKFDGKSFMPIQMWINQIESTVKPSDRNDKTLIKIMKNNIEGDVLQWFLSQEHKDITWEEWKRRLIKYWQAFDGRDRVDKLQEFVCTYRRPDQRLLDYFYTKKKQGESCELTENMICNVIIHRLRDPNLEEGAFMAGCKDIRSLLRYFQERANEDQRHNLSLTCSVCRRRGHSSDQCYDVCKLCHRRGHTSEFCRLK